jgi:hypothetical protein
MRSTHNEADVNFTVGSVKKRTMELSTLGVSIFQTTSSSNQRQNSLSQTNRPYFTVKPIQ